MNIWERKTLKTRAEIEEVEKLVKSSNEEILFILEEFEKKGFWEMNISAEKSKGRMELLGDINRTVICRIEMLFNLVDSLQEKQKRVEAIIYKK